MLGDEEETETDKYIAKLQEHFVPKEGMDASFRLDLTDAGKSLIVDVKGAKPASDSLSEVRGFSKFPFRHYQVSSKKRPL